MEIRALKFQKDQTVYWKDPNQINICKFVSE